MGDSGDSHPFDSRILCKGSKELQRVHHKGSDRLSGGETIFASRKTHLSFGPDKDDDVPDGVEDSVREMTLLLPYSEASPPGPDTEKLPAPTQVPLCLSGRLWHMLALFSYPFLPFTTCARYREATCADANSSVFSARRGLCMAHR